MREKKKEKKRQNIRLINNYRERGGERQRKRERWREGGREGERVRERKGLREGEETDRQRGAHIQRDKNRIYLQCRSGAANRLSERRS